MLAWGAAFLFAFAAVSGAGSTASWMSWPVLACTGMVLLALDQALMRRSRNSSSEEGKPR
jgi:hypothetical protein